MATSELFPETAARVEARTSDPEVLGVLHDYVDHLEMHLGQILGGRT